MSIESRTTKVVPNEWTMLHRAIECPACLEPMQSAIHLCRNGHSVCGTCKQSLRTCPLCRHIFSNQKNHMLMTLIENIKFPCQFEAHGCRDYQYQVNKAYHEANCQFRIYCCNMNDNENKKCTWTGILNKLIDHTKDKHFNNCWMEEDNVDRWKPDEDADNEVQFIRAHDRLFYLHRHVVKEVMYWGLSLIGPDEYANMFTLSVDFENAPPSTRIIQMKDKCHTVDWHMMDQILDGIGMPKELVRTFKNGANGGVWYKVRIIKTDENETLIDDN